MRNSFRFIAAAVTAIALTGCQKHLGSYLESAKKTFAEKNYVDTVDSLNAGLNYWEESEGIDKKAEAYELLGKSYRALRNMDKALDSYQEAVKVSQDRFDAYFDMANIYLTKGFADQAERNFREALRIKPDEPMSLLGLGNSLYSQKKMDEAREAFERIIDTSPGVKDALESLNAMRRPVKPAVKKTVTTPKKKPQPAGIKKNGKKSQPAKRR